VIEWHKEMQTGNAQITVELLHWVVEDLAVLREKNGSRSFFDDLEVAGIDCC
jgi:hypothetical protein